MEMSKALAVAAALADSTRLTLLNVLNGKPHYVEELVHRLQIPASTASFHLKKLEAAGLVSKHREQYYTVYSVNRKALETPLGDLVSGADIEKGLQEQRVHDYRDRVVRTFFDNGRLVRMPVQKKKRRIVLEEFAALFSSGRTYAEREIDTTISMKYDDYCTVRRELVDEHLMVRENGFYRLCSEECVGDHSHNIPAKGTPGRKRAVKERVMDNRATLKRQYKENPPPAGIFRITNKANGKVFIGKGTNIKGKLNGQQLQLEWGSHRNKAMQEDWNRFGPEQFSFEVLDYLQPANDPGQDVQAELAALEELWIAKLECYGEKGYNDRPKERG